MRQNEESWILTGGYHKRLWWGYTSHRSEGHPGSVDFPYKWVNEREEKVGDCIGFMHTHPGFSASPSFRDDATMAQYVFSFGKPLICLIEGIDGLKGHLYYSDEQPPIPIRTLKSFGQLIVGIMPKKPLAAYGLATPDQNAAPVIDKVLLSPHAKTAEEMVSQAVLDANRISDALDREIDERVKGLMRVGKIIDWDEQIRSF